jgi:DNA helicase-2/ATP-dependent DNA helicase PcrA
LWSNREALAVALLGWEEQLLPWWRSLSSPAERLAEERRLFYVTATRAKDRLLITHVAARGRRETGGPSRFHAEAGLWETDRSPAA